MELDMTKGSPSKLITKFIIPIIIGNIFQQLYSMVDTIIVGRFVGVDALAAVGATGSVSFLILGFTQGLTTGFTVLTAQRFGAGDREGMRKSIGSAAILSVIVTIVMTAVSMAGMDRLLRVMNTPEDIFDMTKEYIMIICAGIACNVLYNLLSSILRAIGNSVVPLVLLVIASVTNIVLDYVLRVPTLHIRPEHCRLESQCVKNQLTVGIPMALQFSITAIGTILVQAALNLLGSTVVASYSVSCKVEQLVTQPFAAMGVTMATYCAVLVYGLVYIALPYIVPLFISEQVEMVCGYARTYITICGMFFIPLGMIFIFRNALQGCGFGFMPMMGGVVELLSRGIVAFAAAHLMSYVGVCFANASAWLTAGIFLWIAYHFLMKKMVRDKKGHEERMLAEAMQ